MNREWQHTKKNSSSIKGEAKKKSYDKTKYYSNKKIKTDRDGVTKRKRISATSNNKIVKSVEK